MPALEKAPKARIVIVSSDLHRKSKALDLSTIDDRKKFGFFDPYNRSKLANVSHVCAHQRLSRVERVQLNSRLFAILRDSPSHLQNDGLEGHLQVMHARGLTRRLHRLGIHHVVANSLHPGVVNSNLPRSTPLLKTPIRQITAPFR